MHTANAVSTNVVETNAKVPAPPCMPIPPPSVSASSDIDLKQPDSSDRSEESADEALQSETIVYPEKRDLSEIDVPSDLEDTTTTTTATDKNTETTIVAKSIQVAEVSSSQMLEETGESESKKADELADVVIPENLVDENKRISNQQDEKLEADHDDVHVSIPSDPKSYNDHIESKSEIVDNTVDISSVPQPDNQDSLPDANAEVVPFMNRLLRSGGIPKVTVVRPVQNNDVDGGEVRNTLNGLRHRQQQQQQHAFFAAARTDDRAIERRHSLNSQAQASQNAFTENGASNPDAPKTYVSVKSRYTRISTTKTTSVVSNVTVDEKTKGMSTKRTNGDCTVSSKRRYSTITQASVAPVGAENGCVQQEPCVKRRTRSEDRRQSPTDENDPANQATEDASSRLSWPSSDGRADSTSLNSSATALSAQDKLSASNTFERRSLGKKATPVKAIRRPSINGTNRLQQLRGTFGLRDWDQGRNNRTNNCNDRRTLNRTVTIIGPDTAIPQRWLRLVFFLSLLTII